VKWLNGQTVQMFLWIGPFFNGQMATNALTKGWTLASAGQKPAKENYPLVDFTNPEAKKYWQDGVAKLLKLGVAGFKMDRSEENIPENGSDKVFDGRSVRENRNAYPVMYLQAAYDVARECRSNDDFVCMPRAAYTGSSAHGVFWGGDIAGTEYGLRAEIIAVQRAAVMVIPTGARTPAATASNRRTRKSVAAGSHSVASRPSWKSARRRTGRSGTFTPRQAMTLS